jgi:hypothetical protein
MSHPYASLSAEYFWKTGVATQAPDALTGLYRKRFEIRHAQRIAAAGSCFAQHITQGLKAAGFRVMDMEPAPAGLGARSAEFGYGLYSARYGNIYTARHLLQIAKEALSPQVSRRSDAGRSDAIWEKNGRYFDAMRPSVEPQGLDSAEEVEAHRRYHLHRVRKMLQKMDVFIFTFGLTEAWCHSPSGTTYPIAPGVACGQYDASIHTFVNFTSGEVADDFAAFRSLVHRINPGCKFLVTVSPVPLVATASGRHVLKANTASKAALRASAEVLYNQFDDIDYFPSFELIGTPFLGCAFEPDMRSVSQEAVSTAMSLFFSEHHPPQKQSRLADGRDLVCEEILLEAFA